VTLPPEPPATPPGEDLRVAPLPYEHQAEYIARVRSEGIVSNSPSDIVPNVPWSNMGPPVEVAGDPPPEEDALSAALAAPEHQKAADLIEQAEAAQSDEELDAIEAQAEGRVTVLDAVEKRRSEI
jgi:hypothetical protein